jgi:23S rRNA (guanosine2251-2'-O)-methyltransferase
VLQKLGPGKFVLILSGIQDPFNFGSILRSADLFAVDAVIVPERGQAEVSAHVVRSSVGAVNYLDIVQSDSLAQTCRSVRTRGLRLIAATEAGGKIPESVNLRNGVGIIIGNEGGGIDEELLELCDERIRIPQSGHVGSLNAAVAAGILCYEVRRQRA